MSGGRQPGSAYPGIVILVEGDDESWDAILTPDGDAEIRSCVEAAAHHAGLSPATETELGVRLSSDAEVKILNGQWRGKDKATNILSFPVVPLVPGEAPGPLMGDLVLARETLEREAADEGKAVLDHLRHLLVHGTLHLLGHDHEDDASAETMEALEILALADLGVADPYGEQMNAPTPSLITGSQRR